LQGIFVLHNSKSDVFLCSVYRNEENEEKQNDSLWLISESTKVTKKRKRQNVIIDYFTSSSKTKASSSKYVSQNNETAQLAINRKHCV